MQLCALLGGSVVAASCTEGGFSGTLVEEVEPPPCTSSCPPDPGLSEVRINEVMITNTATLPDEAGHFSPWVELYNPTGAQVNLAGAAFSDDRLAPKKWLLPTGPAAVLPARGYLLIICDGRPPGASQLHAPFTLRPGRIELVFNDGSEVFAADGRALGEDESLGRFPDGGQGIFPLSAPTPGGANAEPSAKPGRGRGDVDRDGKLDLTDATNLLGYLFLGNFVPYCEPVADANDDGTVSLSDPMVILAFLFQGGPPLPELSAEELAECTSNEPPVLAPRGVYETYPGFPVEFAIEATDPEGGPLSFEGVELPTGASIEGETGLVRWLPGEEQLGPFSFAFVVSDGAVPPNRVEGRLVFQVHPLDGCLRPECDPATGCVRILAPLGEDCCGGAGIRVPDADVDCPAGRMLHAGRNSTGSPSIGRLENCDALQLAPLGQGGHMTRLNLEARCLDPRQVRMEARLETATTVLFNESARLDFESRADGFLERRNLRFGAEGPFAEGMEAQLTVALTDTEGVRVERRVRLVLTREPVPDLP